MEQEQRVAWAVRMHASVHAVHAAIKALAAHEADLRTSHTLHMLHPVWQYIVDSSLPPTVIAQKL